MEKIKDSRRVRRVIKIVLICAIFLYPFLHTFIGIDLGDTGYHLYAFENLYKTPELIGFTAYLTTVIGWAWLKIFPGLGLWGLNLLEVFAEMLMVFVVYKTLKAYLRNERNAVHTAKELFIHRSTLFYRLDRIKELIHIDLDDPSTRLYVNISYRILERLEK